MLQNCEKQGLCVGSVYFGNLNKRHIMCILSQNCFLYSKALIFQELLILVHVAIVYCLFCFTVFCSHDHTSSYYMFFCENLHCFQFFLLLQILLLWDFVYCFQGIWGKDFSKVTVASIRISQVLPGISKLFCYCMYSRNFLDIVLPGLLHNN